ncbi:hypothetical protein, partial [Mesorhizobium sp. M8A.F.Ca.ET.198.01.1.1]|uniref:hypothetical protein n=1 Tax=Mesorhizobium sp. M8A.F.Ca.ET.198.01.1.1 TaxID=2563966 RepID=UPI001AEE5E35
TRASQQGKYQAALRRGLLRLIDPFQPNPGTVSARGVETPFRQAGKMPANLGKTAICAYI